MSAHNVVTMPPASLDAALGLTRQGLSVVPVPFRAKGPNLPGWQQLRLTENDLPSHFNGRSQNIGVILGINGLTDIDKDCEEATYIASYFLPETGLEFGRHSAPRSHSLYYSDPPLPRKKFDDPVLAKKNASLPVSERAKSTIIEIRGTKSDGEIGLQTVFPPSVHVAGERIEYARGCTGVIENVEADKLSTGVSKIAAAVLLARYFPCVEGGRNDAFLCINGVLVRAGWVFDDVYTFSLAIRRILYRDKTKESHCRAELEHTMREHAEGKPLIGIPTLKDLVHPDAVRRAFEWLQVGLDVSQPQNSKPGEIIVSNRPNHTITADAIRTLQAVNEPPYIFLRGTQLSTVFHDEDSGSATIRECSEAYIRGEMDRAASYIKLTADDYKKAIPPPIDIVRDLIARPPGELNFPRLKGIVESPVVLDGGRILSKRGYDPESGILYIEQPDFKLPSSMPENPSREDAIAAREFIESEILVDFPFEDDASRHNALAALVTVMARSAIAGPVPMSIIDATNAGTGKGLLTDAISLIATGRAAAMSSLPKDDEETRKAITSALMRNPGGLIVFDNVTGSLSSPALSQALTACIWKDRVLGSSRTIEIPIRCCWFANGNNIEIRGDMARRGCWIRMDAKCSNPFQRQPVGGFRHPELLKWISAHRGQIVAHLLTMCRGWFVNGQPKPASQVRLGSFEQWAETVGGILAYSGADRFMGNTAKFHSSADSEASEWEVFLTGLWHKFRVSGSLCTQRFTVARVVQDLAMNRESASTAPSAVAPYLEKGASGSVSIGRVFEHRRDRRYGKCGLHLSKSGKSSPVKWVVRADQEPALEEDPEEDAA